MTGHTDDESSAVRHDGGSVAMSMFDRANVFGAMEIKTVGCSGIANAGRKPSQTMVVRMTNVNNRTPKASNHDRRGLVAVPKARMFSSIRFARSSSFNLRQRGVGGKNIARGLFEQQQIIAKAIG